MMKFKKILLLFVAMTIAFVATGCMGSNKLDKAFEELEEKSFTVVSDLEIEMTLKYNDKVESFKQTAEMQIEADQSQSYTIMTINGIVQSSYAKIDDDKAKVYTRVDNKWILNETSLDDYNDDDMLAIIDIDTEDIFEESEGVWVCDVEKISGELDEYMKMMAESFGGTGLTVDNMSLDKYTIELDGKHLSKINFEMSVALSDSNVSMEMKISMPLRFLKIGKTNVTVPTGLPE